MSLNIISKKVGGGDDSWLGSRHGVVNAESGTLDATAFTGDDVLSGTPVARSGDKFILADTENATVPVAPEGFVIGDHSIKDGDAIVPILWHGRIKTQNLPGGAFTVPAEPGAFTYVGGNKGA